MGLPGRAGSCIIQPGKPYCEAWAMHGRARFRLHGDVKKGLLRAGEDLLQAFAADGRPVFSRRSTTG